MVIPRPRVKKIIFVYNVSRDADSANKKSASAAKCVAIKIIKNVNAVITAKIQNTTVPVARYAWIRKNPAYVIISVIYAGVRKNPANVVIAAEERTIFQICAYAMITHLKILNNNKLI